MKQGKISIAIVGFGKRGSSHFSAYKKLSQFSVKAVCDERNIFTEKGILYFKRYQDIANLAGVEAVSICLPNSMHYKVAKYFLERKIHVLVEKPLAIKMSHINKLYEIASQNKAILLVGYHLSYEKRVFKIKTLIERRMLGDIVMVRARQSHNWGGGKPFEWLTHKKQSGGGTIIDNATHYLVLLQYLLGPIKEISAVANNILVNSVEDNAIITFKFLNNVIGSIETSWNDSCGRVNEVMIWGTKSVLIFSQKNDTQQFLIKRYTRGNDEWNSMNIELFYQPRGIEQRLKTTSGTLSDDPLINLIAHFGNKINDGMQDYKKDLYAEVSVARLIDSCYKSIKKRKIISII